MVLSHYNQKGLKGRGEGPILHSDLVMVVKVMH